MLQVGFGALDLGLVWSRVLGLGLLQVEILGLVSKRNCVDKLLQVP